MVNPPNYNGNFSSTCKFLIFNKWKFQVLNSWNKLIFKKAIGVDTIRPKLIKPNTRIIAKPLKLTISCFLNQGAFPGKAKIATVVSLD